jgi:hypothetical protein
LLGLLLSRFGLSYLTPTPHHACSAAADLDRPALSRIAVDGSSDCAQRGGTLLAFHHPMR